MTLSLYLRLEVRTLTNEYLHSKLSTLQQAHCFASLLRTKHELELGKKKHFPFRTHQKQNLAEQIHMFRA